MFLNEKLEIRIGDFGLAAKIENENDKKTTLCGTPNYIAPEILDGKNGHSFEVDVWSLGVICYTLLIGKPPFETSNVKSTYKRIKANEYSFPSYIQISNEAVDLVRSILHLEPGAVSTVCVLQQLIHCAFRGLHFALNFDCLQIDGNFV